ncbi:MAG: DUF1553 domain-containing protein [Bryobacterales bacterium]|nr:DUF1553 domain-containing protein [Bryobacterales bacterium]
MKYWAPIVILGVCCAPAPGADAVSFNREVRPILSDKCFACHGPDSVGRKGGLRLDREEDARAKLGTVQQSAVLERITSTNKVKRMPPAYLGHERLTDREIATLRTWIEQGAKYEAFWSLIPPKRTAGRDAIDRLVRERLVKEGLQPSAEASRETLIRRVTLDLTGLPPTRAEVATFVADTAPGAYERVVDRLLASPRYGERMAIRWLEAGRYADTNGYQSDGPRDMWRWRDWVIAAFQKNMPFDQFTVEQIAGDLLPNATTAQRVATAFHRNHPTTAEGGIVDEEYRVQYVADRAETTGTVWLGMTVGCARCHDHKFDPIKQKDYYSLFAYFNNTPDLGFAYNFGNDQPYIPAPLPEQQAKLDEMERRIAAARLAVERAEPKERAAQAKWEKTLKGDNWTVTAGLSHRTAQEEKFDGQRILEVGGKVAQYNYNSAFTFAVWIRPETKNAAILSRGEDQFEGQGHFLHLVEGKLRLHVIYRWSDLGMRLETEEPVRLNEWSHVLVAYDGNMRAAGVRVYVNGVPQKFKVMLDQCMWPMDTKEPFRIGAGGGQRFTGAIRDVRVYDRALTEAEVGAVVLLTEQGRRDRMRLWFQELYGPERKELARLEEERRKYLATVPTVMVMQETRPRPAYVLKRGAYDAHGEEVSPGVPAALPAMKPEWPKNRLGLAYWLVDRGNPLTARVTVNRFWQMLFGTGLVKTVEDFGSQGDWPVHAELLDWLAVEFMDTGWNVKGILKTMVMSATYRQSSAATPELVARDPENRLLARGPRNRLPAEMIRDQALAVSGLLVEKIGGPSVKPYQPPGLWQELSGGKGYEADKGEGLWRRSLYTYWRRTVAPPGMVNFDSPTRETCVVRESRTNTPLQALSLMNDVLYLEAARKMGERVMREGGATDSGRLAYAFGLVLARAPKREEAQMFETALREFRKFYDEHPAEAVKYLQQGAAPQAAGLPAPELAAYAAVSSLVLNLDEAITKE